MTNPRRIAISQEKSLTRKLILLEQGVKPIKFSALLIALYGEGARTKPS
jgi:hypothetical protein